MIREGKYPRFRPPDDGGREFTLWLIQLLIVFLLEWLCGFVQIPRGAPIYHLASLTTIASTILGAVALYLLFIPIRRRFPRVDAALRQLVATRWRVLLLAALVVTCIAIELNGPLLHWVNAQATQHEAAYFTATPGPGCDAKSQRWSQRNTIASIHCTDQGMELSIHPNTPADAMAWGEVAFEPQPSPPGASGTNAQPSSYCVQVSASIVAGGPNTAVSVGVHVQQAPGGQLAEVTELGDVMLVRYTSAGVPEVGSPLFVGHVAAAYTYQLTVGVQGAQITLWVNGTRVAHVSDPIYLTTRYVLLALRAGSGQTAEARYSNFHFVLGASSLASCESA